MPEMPEMSEALARFAADEPGLPALVAACVSELQAAEVWLFGSRARGDHHPWIDWDLLAVIRDDAPVDIEAIPNLWRIRRASGVSADLLAVRMADFLECRATVNTLSGIAFREGVRLAR